MAEKTPAGDMPRMVPDKDDIRSRNVQGSVEKTSSSERKASKTPVAGGQSWVMVTLLIVAGVAIGYMALQQYSLTQLLNSYEERLSLADERIVSLEQALTQTDESVSMNGTAINAQFKAIKTEADLHMDEIRKLWDVTNKRNRQWIEDNKEALATQTKALAAIDSSITALNASQGTDEQMLSKLTSQLEIQKGSIAQIDQSLTGMKADVANAIGVVASVSEANLEERLLTLTLTQENLLAEQGQLSAEQVKNISQIQEMLDGLNAVDAGRLETNKRLTALSGQLDTLAARVTALTGSSQ